MMSDNRWQVLFLPHSCSNLERHAMLTTITQTKIHSELLPGERVLVFPTLEDEPASKTEFYAAAWPYPAHEFYVLSANSWDVARELDDGYAPVGWGVVLSCALYHAIVMIMWFPKRKNDDD